MQGPLINRALLYSVKTSVPLPALAARVYSRVIYKLMASKSEGIRVQSLKVLGYFLKHLGHK